LHDRSELNATREQQVHAHGWDLKSRVLIGSITECTFDLTSGEGALYAVNSTYGEGASVLTLLETGVAGDLSATIERSVGSGLYEIRAGVYHSSATTSGPSATVVATATRHIGRSRVLTGLDAGRRTVENVRLPIVNLPDLLAPYDDLYAVENGDRDMWAAFVFILDSGGNLFLVNTTRRPDLWQPVGGRGDSRDPDPRATALREVLEETGLELPAESLTPLLECERDLGRGRVHFFTTQLAERPVVDLEREEVISGEWLTREQALSRKLYPATRRAMESLPG
jgi:8-oxo-dGTP pyrophosphatase MutT (NUDIX family)